MYNRVTPLDVEWYFPDTKKRIAYSTKACSDLIVELSKYHYRIKDVYSAIHYDREAKTILEIYIDMGFGDSIAGNYFK